MKFCRKTIAHWNRIVDKKNRKARHESKEEKIYTVNAAVGMLTLWKPAPINNSPVESKMEKKSQDSMNNPVLPEELCELIGSFLTRADGSNLARVCKSASKSASDARSLFLKENEKSYEEEPYHPLTTFAIA